MANKKILSILSDGSTLFVYPKRFSLSKSKKKILVQDLVYKAKTKKKSSISKLSSTKKNLFKKNYMN